MPLVSVIIPTKGRDTLPRAINSLKSQIDQDYELIVIGDNISPRDDLTVNVPRKLGYENRAGLLRNIGMGKAKGDWIAFLDDDDRFDKHYTQWLRQSSPETDLHMFTMKMPSGELIPKADMPLTEGRTGISFAVRRDFVEASGVKFINSRVEDWKFVEACQKAGARIFLDQRVAYFVRY